MFSYERINKQLQLDPLVFRSIAFGLILFLYFSITRGFIYVAVSFLVEDLGNLPTAGLGLVPLLVLLFPMDAKKIWINLLPYSIVVWLLSTYISNLIVQLLLLLVGFAITYGSLRYLLLIKQDANYSQAIIWLFLMDQGIRAANRGMDPTMGLNIISVFLISSFAIFTFFLLHINKPSMDVKIEKTSEDVLSSNLAVIALLLNLLAFFIFFANPGVLGLNLEWYSSSSITFLSMLNVGVVYGLYILQPKWKPFEKYIMPTAAILLLLSVVTFPWYDLAIILWIAGLFACVIFLIESLDLFTTSGNWSFTGIIVIGIILNIGLLLQILVTEAPFLFLLVAILGGLFTNLAYFTSKREVAA
ncbi:MAG: hypothetical protein ACXAD7_19900 [Candidatus Kariarchaeaceae archaeon]|jgi:hypothetical protein